MPRSARQIVPNQPHFVAQRGNRDMPVFFKGEDYAKYLDIMAEQAARYNIDYWAYCLLPNRVAMIAVPHDEIGLGLALREAHRCYTRYINEREGWTGHLWQGRYTSFPMDKAYTLIAARYIENMPVRANICENAANFRWSSARYHLGKKPDDPLVKNTHAKYPAPNWAKFLEEGAGGNDNVTEEEQRLAKHEKSGKPLTIFTA